MYWQYGLTILGESINQTCKSVLGLLGEITMRDYFYNPKPKKWLVLKGGEEKEKYQEKKYVYCHMKILYVIRTFLFL